MLQLRPATERDREWLWHLHRATMQPYVDATWGWDEEDQRQRFDAAFDPSQVEVLTVSDEPIGMLRVERRPDEVFIAAIQVTPERQGHGIGTGLLSEVIEEAGERPVTLRVLKVNRARALYDRLGFVAESESETHVAMRRLGGSVGTPRRA